LVLKFGHVRRHVHARDCRLGKARRRQVLTVTYLVAVYPAAFLPPIQLAQPGLQVDDLVGYTALRGHLLWQATALKCKFQFGAKLLHLCTGERSELPKLVKLLFHTVEN
jgi:hypothetical protein